MRICIFGSEIGPVKNGLFVGGSTVSAIRLAQALRAQGDEVFVLSSAPRGKPSARFSFEWGKIDNKQIKGRYMSFPYLLLFLAFSFFGLIHFCKKNKIDVINTHAGTFFLSAIPCFVGKILRIPVFHTQYCEVTSASTGVGAFKRSLVRLCSLIPVKIIGISANVCVSLIRSGVPKGKVQLIFPIVPVPPQNLSHNFEYLSSLGFKKTDYVALFVGNLKKNKGIDLLFEAFANLSLTYPNLRLLVTTELKHQYYIQRKAGFEKILVEKGLVNKVVWLGFVDNMINLIREVDVVVVPFLDLKGISDYPLVVLEAMSVNTPVVATSVGGTPEVFNDDAGVLVPPGDVEALSKGLSTVITKNYFSAPNTAKLLLEKFDTEVIGRKYHNMFKSELTKLGRR
jgi:glycosyltransferase involved in cell wall biosynthesis